MSRGRLFRSVGAVLMVLLLTLGLSTAALAKQHKNKVKLKGPSTNKIGTKFIYKAHGSAGASANKLFLYESTIPCRPSLFQEGRTGSPLVGNFDLKPNKKFSHKVTLTATSPGTQYLCAYVANFNSRKGVGTALATKQASWVNHP